MSNVPKDSFFPEDFDQWNIYRVIYGIGWAQSWQEVFGVGLGKGWGNLARGQKTQEKEAVQTPGENEV